MADAIGLENPICVICIWVSLPPFNTFADLLFKNASNLLSPGQQVADQDSKPGLHAFKFDVLSSSTIHVNVRVVKCLSLSVRVSWGC